MEKKERMVSIPRIGLKLCTKRSSGAINRIWQQPAGWCKIHSIIKLPSEMIIFLIGPGGKEIYSFVPPISKCTLEASLPFSLGKRPTTSGTMLPLTS